MTQVSKSIELCQSIISESKSSLKLNIGAGTDIKPDYLNADLIEGPGIDVTFNILDTWPFPDSTFEEILASHVVEHLPQRNLADNEYKDAFIHFVEEAHRVLKPNGVLHIKVPYHGLPPRYFYQNPTHYRYILPENFNGFMGLKGTCISRWSPARFSKLKHRINRVPWPYKFVWRGPITNPSSQSKRTTNLISAIRWKVRTIGMKLNIGWPLETEIWIWK